MARNDETVPCPNCGNPTYSDTEEPGVIYCCKSEKPVLVCDATPVWKEEAQQQALAEENQRRSRTSEEQLEAAK